MHAGTLALLDDPADEPLESWAKHDDFPPVLVVDQTQDSLSGDSVAQTGTVAARVSSTGKDIDVGRDSQGPFIDVQHTDTVETLVTDWVADVTGEGIVVAGSVAADDEQFPFPFDVFTARTDSRCRRQAIDIETLGRTWANDGVLSDVWMAGDKVGDAVNIRYHNTRESDAQNVSIGLGFERTYEGSVARGIVYAGGYVAIWRDWTAAKFCQFVADELLPFAERFDYEAEQADLSEVFD